MELLAPPAHRAITSQIVNVIVRQALRGSGALASDLFNLPEVVPIMAAHGLHDGLQRHVPAFGMIHGTREVRSAERLHQEARARRYAGYSVEAALATFSALRHWNLALVKGMHHVAIFGQRLARSTCPAHWVVRHARRRFRKPRCYCVSASGANVVILRHGTG
jgi:hypothetical protein